MKNKKDEEKNQDETIGELELDREDEAQTGDEADIKEKEADDSGVVIAKSKMVLVKKLLQNIKENNDQLIQLLSAFVSPEDEARIGVGQAMDERAASSSSTVISDEGKVIEGVFDGENMIGPDGKQYSVPANYASKSKLVEGDILKLSITDNGTFIYKQIGPIERDRVVGELHRAGDNEYMVVADGKSWRILNASVSYFKGQEGDEVVILVPKSGESKWAAVENIIRKR